MENSIIYFLVFNSNNNFNDESWNDLQLLTTHNLMVGDIINLEKEAYSDSLTKDFETCIFEIVSRTFTSDSDNDSTGGIIKLILKPID